MYLEVFKIKMYWIKYCQNSELIKPCYFQRNFATLTSLRKLMQMQRVPAGLTWSGWSGCAISSNQTSHSPTHQPTQSTLTTHPVQQNVHKNVHNVHKNVHHLHIQCTSKSSWTMNIYIFKPTQQINLLPIFY